jgi:hypothetical protein
VEGFKHNRNAQELPILEYYKKQPNGYLLWYKKLQDMYFFGNQSELFDCFLIVLSDGVFITYNTQKYLSIDFMLYVRKTLPDNPRDKRKRYYGSTKKP